RREVVLEQVLQQAGSDCGPQVFLRVSAPGPDELPDVLRLLLDELAHLDDGLPAGVRALFDRLTGEQRLSLPNRFMHVPQSPRFSPSFSPTSRLALSRNTAWCWPSGNSRRTKSRYAPIGASGQSLP